MMRAQHLRVWRRRRAERFEMLTGIGAPRLAGKARPMRLIGLIARDDQEPENAAGNQSDHILISRIARQDQGAMKVLMARYQVRIFRFVIRFVKNREVAEDVVRDTFFAVWQGAPRFESRSSVSTWLLGIARNKALSARQRFGTPSEPLSDALTATLVDPTELPDLAIERRQSIQQLRECLEMLPPGDGALFDLVYYHEKSLREVAAITGVPVNTVKTRMLRARKRLASLLSAYGEFAAQDASVAAEESPGETGAERWAASPTLQPSDRGDLARPRESRALRARAL
jgi:RNA polymerase sigma-70 factor, ECF subfamily